MTVLRMIACLAAVLAVAAAGAAPAGAFGDAQGAAAYDCALELQPAKRLPASAAVTLLLDWQDAATHTRVTVTRERVTVEAVAGRKRREVGTADVSTAPGEPLRMTVMRRGELLGIRQGERLLWSGAVPRSDGSLAGATATAGWQIATATLDVPEPVVFADNFMRAAEEPGAWTVRGGAWRLASAWDDDPRGTARRFTYAVTAQNPFAWRGAADAEGKDALCTTGRPEWEDYTLSAAIRPPATGAVGLAVNVTGDRAIVARWSSAADRGSRGNQLGLYLLEHGALTPLQTLSGGYLPAQWSRLTVATGLGAVRVLVDGQERLSVSGVTPWRGGVGLYVEGAAGAAFDDVTAYGRALNADLLYEEQQVAVAQRIKNDAIAQGEWESRNDWRPQEPGVYTHRQEFFGDHRLSLAVTPTGGTGRLWLALNTDGRNLASGYRATIEPDVKGVTTYAIYRDGARLAQQVGQTMTKGERYAVRFWRDGGRLRLDIDGQTMAQAAIDAPVAGRRPGYRAEGAYANIEDPVVLGRNVLDYTFAEAPTDWIADGAWASTVRWACSPEWSFLGGYSRGDAALWHKKSFAGDQTFEAFIGPKMEFPREMHVYLEQHYRDMCITICGDGQNPRTGYTALCGAPDADGKPTRRAVLLRNGVAVGGRDNVFTGWPYTDAGHRAWYSVELRKRGATVEMWVEGAPVVSYTDPQPINEGVPAIWTTDNGIMVARARLLFATPPQPRVAPRVALDNPTYREWFDLGAPVTLDFPGLCSTSGRPAALRVRALATPAGAAAPLTRGTRLTFTPTEIGAYWFQVNGVDGDQQSPSFHLFGPAFNPALGRDDSRALVLYRFDEGDGDVVRDRSPQDAPADLRIAPQSVAAWLPERGLNFRGGPALRADTAGGKLAVLAATRSVTVELWLSTDSLYPPPNQVWTGSIVDWEGKAHAPNFALAHRSYTPFVVGCGNIFSHGDARNYVIGPQFRTSLHHWALTWDGTTTRCYRDGALVGEREYDWNPAGWNPAAPLLLGNTFVGDHPYLGTYYLAAIHDRCFTPAQVLRHYQAGPNATSNADDPKSPKSGKGG